MDTLNLELLVKDGMEIEANQVQYSLLDRRAENQLLPLCRKEKIKLLVFGVVAGGVLSDSFLGISKEQAQAKTSDSVSRRMYWSSLERWSTDWALFQELLETLRAVGQRLSPQPQNVAFVACAWALQRLESLGAGGALILGVRDAGHLEEHRALLDGEVKLGAADMDQIQAVLDKGLSPQGDIWYQERGWL
ncbi:unnamed protein product [Polarella glacialis]|uniref:NADP-dependent oxidoreductase domain-containing protein n=1 Tax=Polarella glacialis TaxID=89957 RepID=A0A813LUY5_POLGL|nr:unnamed protein product [Polarella glacialis]